MAGAGVLNTPARLRALLLECAAAEGFPLAAVVDIEPVLASAEFSQHLARFDRWIARGSQGSMQYLVRGRNRRADPRTVLPGAKSMLCVALPYPRRPAGAEGAAVGPRYARYIQGSDYHQEVAEKLERVMARVLAALEAEGAPTPKYKVCCDTSAVLERSWAALAGLGWIGKNTLLIHPKLGSYLFLAEVLLDQETGELPRPVADYCGHCTRCLDACPTRAFVGPHDLEARRCISYHTLENRGEITLAPEERDRIGTWIAGCDLCQEVCPWNQKPVKAELSSPVPEIGADATAVRDWPRLLDETEEEYRERVRGSSLNRVKPHQFSRNLALTLANGYLAASHDERVRMREVLGERVRRRISEEAEPIALAEWRRCARVMALD